MKPIFHASRAMLEKKPPHGKPCNQCGLCCVAMICQVGQRLFGRERGPCPALTRNADGAYGCGVIAETTGKMRDAALLLIRAGEGCDARFNGEPTDKAFHAQQDRNDIINRERITEAKRLWGIS